MANDVASLGIQRIAALHVFVRDLVRSKEHYIKQLGFKELARSTREFEDGHGARSSVVQAGDARFVFFEPLGSKSESFRWLRRHPEGVGRVVFDVADADRAYALLTERGATAVTGIERRRVDDATVSWFDIATPAGDTLFRFVDRAGGDALMPDLERLEQPSVRRPNADTDATENPLGISKIDHLTFNYLTLGPAIMWLEKVMGFERFWEVAFHTQDVKKGHVDGSGLKSVVMRDPCSGVNFANNEPAPPRFRASQIFVFCEDHGGPGIQHVALEVQDILAATRALRKLGVAFMQTPGAYYDALPQRLTDLGVQGIDEDIAALRELQVLVDGSNPHQYLLQIFMDEAAALFDDPQAGPMFIELIQRKGDRGFGGGNFRALFESIERAQQTEGRA